MNIDGGSALRATREALGLSQAKLSELTGIPQHMLSAIELQKAPPNHHLLKKALEALGDANRVGQIVARKKRYQVHAYAQKMHDPERVKRHSQSKGNNAYLRLLNNLNGTFLSRKHTVMSLFAGCGGLSLGFSWAGFDLVGFLEADKEIGKIYRANFPKSIQVGGDISNLTDSEIAAIATKIGHVDVIVGGPPCQGFSLSGKRSINDPRNTLFLDYLRFVDACRPRIAILENVRLLTSMKSATGGFVSDEIQRQFLNHGYITSMYQVNAKYYGVPQHRERIFFVAARSDLGLKPSFPSHSHNDVELELFPDLPLCRTFADACSDLDYLESGEDSHDPLHSAVAHPRHVIEWLWDVAEGRSAHDNKNPQNRPPSGYNTTYKRQVWSLPGATVQTTFGMISGCRNVHPICTRSLTLREAARLQSFPDQFSFPGTLGTVRTGIGNAVPPLLAYQIANHLSLNVL